MSTISVLSLFLIWKAQKKLTEHQSSGAPDKFDDDPLKYTAVRVLCFVPAVLGVLKVIASASGKDKQIRESWANLVRSHDDYWFLSRMYAGNLLMYLSLGSACLGMDILKKPAFLYKYKIQPDAVIDYSTALPKLFRTLALNIASPVLLGIIPGTDRIKQVLAALLRRFIRISPELPSIWEVTKHYWVFLFTYDILFFYSHWALHTKTLYSWIHKQHHEWKSPTALAAAYAHPIEHMVSNVAPAIVATLYLRPHITTFGLYSTIGLLITLAEHSGYEFVDSSSFHNLHHRTFTSNFGLFGLYDEFHGTRVYAAPHINAGGGGGTDGKANS